MSNIIQTRVCTHCGEELTLCAFNKSNGRLDGLLPYCRECQKIVNASYRSIPANYVRDRANKLRNRGAICSLTGGPVTDEEVRKLMYSTEQCPLCFRVGKISGKELKQAEPDPNSEYDFVKLVIDHDHVTHLLRGILCDDCNTQLGRYKKKNQVEENIALFRTFWAPAVQYLEFHMSRHRRILRRLEGLKHETAAA